MNIIRQSMEFPAAPEQLFDIFLDSKKHSEATRAKATVSRKAGGKFTAFDGMLAGRNLVIVPHRLIVQAWRATHWKKSDEGSILILKFSGNKTRGRIDLVHVNVPDHDYLGVKKGWPHYYWKPWRKYLERTR